MGSQKFVKHHHFLIAAEDKRMIEEIQTVNNSWMNMIANTPKDCYEPLVHIPFKAECQSTTEKEVKHGSLTCVVCGASAFGFNFDAITCESCKAFFRRNALKNNTALRCRRIGHCAITIDTRRRCPACRLDKCFKEGMNREKLLMGTKNNAKRSKVEHGLHRQSLSRKNESRHDTDNFFQETPVLLTSDDSQWVETIRNLYLQRIELAARYGLPWDPSIYAQTPLDYINSRSISAMRLLAFFRQIPQFNQLHVEDKVTLIKYNLFPLILLSYALAYKNDTDQIIESDTDVPLDPNSFQRIHGYNAYLKIKTIFDSFVQIAQYDETIMHLALVILILTKGIATDLEHEEPTLHDELTVYQAQTYYIDLLWKYMATKHGSEASTKIIFRLVSSFMSWQTLEKQLRLNIRELLLKIGTHALVPIMKSLLHMK